MQKKLILALYIVIVVSMGFATVIEKYHGTEYAGEHVYGAWWFTALWAVLAALGGAYMVQQRLYRRMAVFLLHVSMVVVLVGALTTRVTAVRGTVRLRTNTTVATFAGQDNRVHRLPIPLRLKSFRIVNYPGTDAPLDYQGVIEWGEGEVLVSMNHIGCIDGYRLFLQNYDSDGEGVTMGVGYDPWGIAITYTGYILLLAGMIATLLSRRTRMRALYRRAMATAVVMLVASIGAHASAAHPPREVDGKGLPVVDREIARRLGSVSVLYNNRICPLNTVATDFVTSLSGGASWDGYSADEVFISWMIYYSQWEHQKLIRVKSRHVQRLLGIDSQWASYSDFLDEHHGYKLKDAVKGSLPAGGRALLDADEKFHVVEMFYRGQFVRMFPCRVGKAVNWYMPGSRSLPREIPVEQQFFIRQAMDFLTESIVTGQRDRAFEIIAKIRFFQHEMIGDLIPSSSATKAELCYNVLRSQKWPVFLALSLSLLLCVAMFTTAIGGKWLLAVALTLVALLEVYITLQIALRWWLGNHVPVSNGPETMLFMAWVLLLLTLMLRKNFQIITAIGPLISSFCLLVAMLGGSSQITPLMPVLQSPLLSVHVMTVMSAYALFALQWLLGIYAQCLAWLSCVPWVASDQRSSGRFLALGWCSGASRRSCRRIYNSHKRMNLKTHELKNSKTHELKKVTALSQFLLYPAVFLIIIGIFLGAVWANVSWGSYWSWDPKETWALITLMVYAVPLHSRSIPLLRHPRGYHLYMVCAFLCVIITYFGVNYLLGGMHSYAVSS